MQITSITRMSRKIAVVHLFGKPKGAEVPRRKKQQQKTTYSFIRASDVDGCMLLTAGPATE